MGKSSGNILALLFFRPQFIACQSCPPIFSFRQLALLAPCGFWHSYVCADRELEDFCDAVNPDKIPDPSLI